MKDNIARRKRVDIMYTYYNNCVNWPASDVYASGGLSDMVQYGITITRRTFQHNVGASVLAEFELNMGYPCGQLTMKDDYAVSYHRGKLHGQRVYWVSHSSIEYVFVPEDYLNKKENSRLRKAPKQPLVGRSDGRRMKYPDTEPICSCDECIYKDPKRERCRKVVAPLPSGRRCSASIRKTSNRSISNYCGCCKK